MYSLMHPLFLSFIVQNEKQSYQSVVRGAPNMRSLTTRAFLSDLQMIPVLTCTRKLLTRHT